MVALSAWYGGRLFGFLTLGASVLLVQEFLLTPREFDQLPTGGYAAMVLFLFMSSATILLIGTLHKARLSEREARAELEDALSLRETFLSIAAHELRTPLTSLLIQLEWLGRKAEAGDLASEKVAQRLPTMIRQLWRLDGLVGEMLDVVRLQKGSRKLVIEPTDLVPIVRDVLDHLQPLFESSQTPVTLKSEPQLLGQWDRLLLEQIVTNLLTNAAKYGNAKPVEITLSTDGSAATIEVRDRGIGIAEEDFPGLFGQFQRVGSRAGTPGLGLGLWITRQCARNLGGEVDLTSRLGDGTIFVVTLPLSGPKRPPKSLPPVVRAHTG